MIFKEEKSFFEHLNFGDSERVHSEFFAWLLSPDCKVIAENEKINFIKNLFQLEATSKIIKTGTEIDKADIFIETEDSILIIENKIKSSQHSNQLDRYKILVERKYPEKKHYFIFLTLVNEQRANNEWTHVSYFEIHQELKKLKLLDDRHSAFIEDYILYLTKLLSVLNDVISAPKEFESVFKNGSLKKSEKLHFKFKNKKEEFIAKNQLETILQKAFLSKLLENDKIKKLSGNLTETRGTALIDFPLKRNISIDGKKLYTTFIQIQSDNIKFAFAIQKNYEKSKREWIYQIIEIFKNFKNQNIKGFCKINSPKSLAYVSISKKMKTPYWAMSWEEIVTMIQTEIQTGHELTDKLMIEIENTFGNRSDGSAIK